MNPDFFKKIDEIKKANDKIFNLSINKIETKKNIIFVYTPPKVGSTSLVSSLRISLSNTFSIIHIHDEIMLKFFTGIQNISINEIIQYNKYIGKNVYVIDIYRTQIERNISDFFENLACQHFNNSEENINNYNIDKIINRFNSIFPYLPYNDYYTELYNIPKLDNFDFNKKYLYQVVNNIHYIKLRLKDSSEWNKILTSLLGYEIVIINDYQTTNKIIGKLYDNFKKIYKIPSNLLDSIKKCKYLSYYYSEKERNEYLNTWESKVTSYFETYTKEQYDVYLKICLENQYLPNIDNNHYIDLGCLCKPCSIKRQELFQKAKNGTLISEKINHNDLVNEYNKKQLIISQNNKNNNKYPDKIRKINTQTNKSFNHAKMSATMQNIMNIKN
uniref:Uncharacterized protein n=1 Tax=viral metagenome TaxID=1070528 RepID=A0A6C0IJM9_9ZZZZ